MGEDKRGFRAPETDETAAPDYPRWRAPGAGARDTGAEGGDRPEVPIERPDLDAMPIPTSGMVPQPHDRWYPDNEGGGLWRQLIDFLRGRRR